MGSVPGARVRAAPQSDRMLLPALLLAPLLLPAPQAKPARKPPDAQAERARKEAALAGASVAASEIESAIQRGIALLLAQQESLEPAGATKDEWPYEGVYRAQEIRGKPPVIPLGYRVGGTSIAAIALIEASGAKPRQDVRAALERALGFVLAKLDDPFLDEQFLHGYDVRGWGHAYGLAFLLRLREAGLVPEERGKSVDAAIHALVARLARTAIQEPGGWNYARGQDPAHAAPSTFMTAPTLQILFEAARAGEEVERGVVEKALAALESARIESSGAFQYGADPAHQTGKGFEDVPGAIGRTPVCEVTLYLAGRGSVERIRSALEAFFAHWEWLEARRRHDQTHLPPYMIAPYYFFYAHRYAAQAIECLPEAERAGFRERLVKLLWAVREADGGWNDRVFPRSENFGTAMTLLALAAPRSRPPAGWIRGKSNEEK